MEFEIQFAKQYQNYHGLFCLYITKTEIKNMMKPNSQSRFFFANMNVQKQTHKHVS